MPLDIGICLTNLHMSRTNICHVTHMTHTDASTGTPLDIGMCLTNSAPATNWMTSFHVEILLFTLNAFSLHSKLRHNERETGREREGERILVESQCFCLKPWPDGKCFSNDNTCVMYIHTNAHKYTRTYAHPERGNEHGVGRIRDESHSFDLNAFSALIFSSDRQRECAHSFHLEPRPHAPDVLSLSLSIHMLHPAKRALCLIKRAVHLKRDGLRTRQRRWVQGG